jgi:hypothetical protein
MFQRFVANSAIRVRERAVSRFVRRLLTSRKRRSGRLPDPASGGLRVVVLQLSLAAMILQHSASFSRVQLERYAVTSVVSSWLPGRWLATEACQMKSARSTQLGVYMYESPF